MVDEHQTTVEAIAVARLAAVRCVSIRPQKVVSTGALREHLKEAVLHNNRVSVKKLSNALRHRIIVAMKASFSQRFLLREGAQQPIGVN